MHGVPVGWCCDLAAELVAGSWRWRARGQGCGANADIAARDGRESAARELGGGAFLAGETKAPGGGVPRCS